MITEFMIMIIEFEMQDSGEIVKKYMVIGRVLDSVEINIGKFSSQSFGGVSLHVKQ